MASSEQVLIASIAFFAGLALAGLGFTFWKIYERSRRSRNVEDRFAIPLLEAMETIASTPVERLAVAEAVALSAEKVFAFDALQFGIYEASHFLALKRIRFGEELPPNRRETGIEAEGLSGWGLRHRAPQVFVRDQPTSLDRDFPHVEGETLLDQGSFLIVPIHGKEYPLGMLCLESLSPGAFDDAALELAERISAALTSVMARLRIQTEIETRSTQMVLLSEISRRLISLQPLEDRFHQVAPVISQAFDFAHVRLYECSGQTAYVRAASHEDEDEPSEVPYGHGLVGRSAEERRTLELHEADLDTNDNSPGIGSSTPNALAVPLAIEDRMFGVLKLTFPDGRLFSAAQIAFAELVASMLAIASLEAKNYAQQQEYTWINTVLLEVAKHAAQPGDPETALRAVLQLTTLLAGARWATLLLAAEADDLLRLGPTAGLPRTAVDLMASMSLLPSDFGVGPPYSDTETPDTIDLPDALAEIVDDPTSLAFALSDGRRLVGILLVGAPPLTTMRSALLAGIAHQISLRIENTRLIEEVAARRSLERELETARSIQESFLPESMPRVVGWDVGAIWVAARQVGGDFFDFIPLPDQGGAQRWGVAIADVADKGVPAALFMALCRTLLRSVAPTHSDPGATLTYLNHLIFSETRPDLFISVFYAVWEPNRGKITFANGGHNPPLLRSPDGKVRPITAHGMVLGVDEGATYKTHTLSIPEEGTLLLYTDGVTEACDEANNQFGLDKLAQLLQTSAQERDAQGLTYLIANAIADFGPDQEPFDDLTAVVLKHLPSQVVG
jgi:serine phosphatase RsbU (regulator of sigma subunit)/GAF domain-containing protein